MSEVPLYDAGAGRGRRDQERHALGQGTKEKKFFIGSLLVRIHFIIKTIWWTGLTPWKFESPSSGSLLSSFSKYPGRHTLRQSAEHQKAEHPDGKSETLNLKPETLDPQLSNHKP